MSMLFMHLFTYGGCSIRVSLPHSFTFVWFVTLYVAVTLISFMPSKSTAVIVNTNFQVILPWFTIVKIYQIHSKLGT